MRLRYQLMTVAALTLALPVLVWVGMKGMDEALKSASNEKLERMAGAVRQYVETVSDTQSAAPYFTALGPALQRGVDPWIATPLAYPVTLDGYDDEWTHSRLQYQYLPTASASDGKPAPRVRLAIRGEALFVFLTIPDDTLVFHQPRQPASNSEFEQFEAAEIRPPVATGDHVTLIEGGDVIRSTVFRAVAPGPMVGQRYGQSSEGVTPIIADTSYRGVWVTTSDGYQMELAIPLPRPGTLLAIRIQDYDTRQAYMKDYLSYQPSQITTASIDIGYQRPLLYPSAELSHQLENLIQAGSQLRVFDRAGHLIAESNQLYDALSSSHGSNHADSSVVNAVLYRLFEWMLNRDQPRISNAWQLSSTHRLKLDTATSLPVIMGGNDDLSGRVKRYTNLEDDAVVGSLQPIVSEGDTVGFLLLETRDDVDTAFASTAMVRIFLLVTVASLLVTAVLLLYASWLSYRIRDVTQQARRAVSIDGRVQQAIKPSVQHDEIGELSRSLSRLVDRSSGYTQYLESLASRLTHEFRTPLSVIQTSLENLDNAALGSTEQQLIARASGGAEHLSALIRSMNEATRLEQVIAQHEQTWFDPRQWLENAVAGYRAVYPSQEFALSFQETAHETSVGGVATHWFAMPDTLQQALDKLIVNAVDFSTPGYPVTIVVQQSVGSARITVRNIALLADLPSEQLASDASALFEPLVSYRSDRRPRLVQQRAHLGLGLYIVKLVSEAHGGAPFMQVEQDGALPAQLSGVSAGFTLKTE